MKKLLLASASIRRKELLEQIGVSYQSAAMDIDESVHKGEGACDYVERLAREKAQAALRSYPDRVVLAADTTVVVNGTILGKPDNEQDAKEMLKQLSGSRHQVLTGFAMASDTQGEFKIESQVVQTEVYFASLSDFEIEQYVKTGEPMGKAGAYGIQGKAALFVDRIEGSYSNVVGLPLSETAKMLQRFNRPIWTED